LDQIKYSQHLNHPNIVKFHGISTTIVKDGEATINFLSEYCEEKSLKAYLRKKRGDVDKWRLMYELALAIDYLHSGEATESGDPLMHGDIRPSKILISKNGHAKLTGFRRSRILDYHKLNEGFRLNHSTQSGNEIWRAPETFEADEDGQSGVHYIQSDIYAWAVTAASVLCTTWTGLRDDAFDPVVPYKMESAYHSFTLMNIIRSPNKEPFKEGDLVTAIPNETLRDLLKRCWSKKKDKRPSIGEVVAELGRVAGYGDDNECSEPNASSPSVALPTPPKTPLTSSDNVSSM